MRRLFWVAVGAAAGVYAMRKVQSVVYAYSPAGLADRAAGAGESVRALVQEITDRMAERESDLRQALGLSEGHDAGLIRTIRHGVAAAGATSATGAISRPALSPAAAADLIDHPASDRPGRGYPDQKPSGTAADPTARTDTRPPRSTT